MSEVATKNDLNLLEGSLRKEIKSAVDYLSNVMQNMMQRISNEFDKAREEREYLKQSIDRLTNTLDGFAKRIENAEVENAARDAQFERLLEWAKKVSKKTGIPLETL